MVFLVNKIDKTRVSLNNYIIDSNIICTFMENYTLDITIKYNKQIYKMLNYNYYIEINSYNNTIENFDFDSISITENDDIQIKCTNSILKKLDKDSFDSDILKLDNNCIDILFKDTNINVNYNKFYISNPINKEIKDCLTKTKFDIFKELINNYGLIYYIENNTLYITININNEKLTIKEDEIVSYTIDKDLTNYYNYVVFYTDTKDIKAFKDFRENENDIIYKKNEITNIKNDELKDSYLSKENKLLSLALNKYYYNVKETERYDYKNDIINIQCMSNKKLKIGALCNVSVENDYNDVLVLEVEYNPILNFINNVKLGKKEKEIIELIKDDKEEVTEDKVNDIVDTKVDIMKDTIKDTIKNDVNNQISTAKDEIRKDINRKFYVTGNIRIRNDEIIDVTKIYDCPFTITSSTTIIPIISTVKNSFELIGGVISGFDLNLVYPNIHCKIKVLNCNDNCTIEDKDAYIDFKILYIDESNKSSSESGSSTN